MYIFICIPFIHVCIVYIFYVHQWQFLCTHTCYNAHMFIMYKYIHSLYINVYIFCVNTYKNKGWAVMCPTSWCVKFKNIKLHMIFCSKIARAIHIEISVKMCQFTRIPMTCLNVSFLLQNFCQYIKVFFLRRVVALGNFLSEVWESGSSLHKRASNKGPH